MRRWSLRLAQVALTVGVTWVIVSRVGVGMEELSGMRGYLIQAEVGGLLLASGVLLGGYLLSALIWGRMVQDLGGPHLPPIAAISHFMIASLGRYLPGRVWSVAGLAALSRRDGVSAATATGAAILGHALALLAASAIGSVALVRLVAPLPGGEVLVVVALAAGVLMVGVPGLFRAAAAGWFRVLREVPPPEISRVHGLRWLAAYLLNWGVFALSFWVFVRSFGSAGSLLSVSSAFAAAYVLGYLMIFAPAGLGPREGFLIFFLTPELGGGPAARLAVAARVWTTLLEVAPAGLLWVRHLLASRGSVTGPEPKGDHDHG